MKIIYKNGMYFLILPARFMVREKKVKLHVENIFMKWMIDLLIKNIK